MLVWTAQYWLSKVPILSICQEQTNGVDFSMVSSYNKQSNFSESEEFDCCTCSIVSISSVFDRNPWKL